jgi:hypothetical protein
MNEPCATLKQAISHQLKILINKKRLLRKYKNLFSFVMTVFRFHLSENREKTSAGATKYYSHGRLGITSSYANPLSHQLQYLTKYPWIAIGYFKPAARQ